MRTTGRDANKPGEYGRPNLLFFLVIGVLFFGHLPASGAQVSFRQYEVIHGLAKRPTVFTGFLLGGAVAELAVLTIDENNDRRLDIYAFDEKSWAPRPGIILGRQVSFVDVANIAGNDRLVTYQPGRLNWFDLESATERPLVEVTSAFDPPRQDEIPHVDITHDVNHDLRDDLIVPDVDGFWVVIQMSDGSFADPVKVGSATDLGRITGADGYRYDPWSQSRVHEIDYNLDGRSDLAFWNKDHFEVHLQDGRGLFAPATQTFTTEVSFDSDALDSLASGSLRGRVLHTLADLNGDGVGDLVVYSLDGEKISSKRSSYEVHFGKPTPEGGTIFTRDADHTFQSEKKILVGMDRQDFDRDGQVDLMLTTIDVEYLEGSLWKRFKGAMGDDVWLDLEFYRMQAGRYPAQPDTTRRIALDGPPSHQEPGWVPLDIILRGGTHKSRKTQKSWPRAFNTTLRIADLTADGRLDLIISDHPRMISIFLAVTEPGLFSKRSQEVEIPVPNDEEYIWLTDLNRDGRQDIIMHHPFTSRNVHGAQKLPPGSEPHRVSLLIAR